MEEEFEDPVDDQEYDPSDESEEEQPATSLLPLDRADLYDFLSPNIHYCVHPSPTSLAYAKGTFRIGFDTIVALLTEQLKTC